MPVPIRFLIGGLLLAALACRPPGDGLRLDPEGLSLLRMEYLERAEQLPALRFDQVELPASQRLGIFSPLRWELRAPSLPEDEALRALPYADPGPRLREAIAHSLRSFGFDTGAAAGRPALRLAVEVERLVLRSEGAPAERRTCELDGVVRIAEALTDLEICRYSVHGRCELPGSWLALRKGHAQWAPRPGEADPLVEAAIAATEDFLQQSLPFWREPANWEEDGISLTGRDSAAAQSP